MRVAVATRSMNDYLFAASGQLAQLGRVDASDLVDCGRHRITGTGMDSFGYFRELLNLPADWVVNLDEDAFLLKPQLLIDLIRYMEENGHTACGMPDGGVVPIRRHNPAAVNAFFNIFDMRRVRPVWNDWVRVRAASHRPEYENGVAPFARRCAYSFDHFERYYGAFFSLLEAGEKILYLDADTWEDGVSTLLKDHTGEALLLHLWYTRNWLTSYHTRERYRRAMAFARQAQGLENATEETTVTPPGSQSNAGRWEPLYRESREAEPYGDACTYEKIARFLQGVDTVEDWGCGRAWLKRYLQPPTSYKGVDGSSSRFADKVVDLVTYVSQADGVVLRHVLEHNNDWSQILRNAVRSFRKRLALVLFTPFVEKTHAIGHNAALGVPDLSFAKEDLIRHFADYRWSLQENIETTTQYGIEHVFYIEKS
jgi:hypothetical protein